MLFWRPWLPHVSVRVCNKFYHVSLSSVGGRQDTFLLNIHILCDVSDTFCCVWFREELLSAVRHSQYSVQWSADRLTRHRTQKYIITFTVCSYQYVHHPKLLKQCTSVAKCCSSFGWYLNHHSHSVFIRMIKLNIYVSYCFW